MHCTGFRLTLDLDLNLLMSSPERGSAGGMGDDLRVPALGLLHLLQLLHLLHLLLEAQCSSVRRPKPEHDPMGPWGRAMGTVQGLIKNTTRGRG